MPIRFLEVFTAGALDRDYFSNKSIGFRDHKCEPDTPNSLARIEFKSNWAKVYISNSLVLIASLTNLPINEGAPSAETLSSEKELRKPEAS